MAARAPTVTESVVDSPDSDNAETRFSTPVSDLDDHRQQESTRPRGSTLNATPNHHVSRISTEPISKSPNFPRNVGSPEIHQIREKLGSDLLESKYPEHAVLDDDASLHGENIMERRNSWGVPFAPRRATTRGSRNPMKSRDSSTSSRSSSPANSIDAFANPRRRANTVESMVHSELELGMKRTISGGTHCRRPTFNNGSVRDVNLHEDRASIRAAEEDVCFPVIDEPKKTYKIDYEELDELVAKQRNSSICPQAGCRQKLSFGSYSEKTKQANDLKDSLITGTAPDDMKPLAVGSKAPNESSDDVLNEKLQARSNASLDRLDSRDSDHPTEGGRYHFFSTELEQTIHAVHFGDLLATGETSRDLFELPEDGGVWWLDMFNPTEDEMEAFQKAFGIHRLTTEDIMTQEDREKVELFKLYYFVCFRSFHQVDEKHEDFMEPVNVYMVVFREGIITVTFDKSPHAVNVRKRISKLRDFMALTADWICYAMIDNIVDTFGPPIHNIEVEADTIEDQVFVARQDDFAELLHQIGHCRKKVMSLMRLLGGKADVIKGFAKRCNEQYSVTPRGEIGLYLGDIQDHVVTMMSNLGHFEKMLSRSHSNYLAQLSVSHIAQGNRANEVLSKITLLASILVPLNLICGLFGMNVNIPGKNVDGYGWFFGILGVIALFVLGSLAIARRLRYI